MARLIIFWIETRTAWVACLARVFVPRLVSAWVSLLRPVLACKPGFSPLYAMAGFGFLCTEAGFCLFRALDSFYLLRAEADFCLLCPKAGFCLLRVKADFSFSLCAEIRFRLDLLVTSSGDLDRFPTWLKVTKFGNCDWINEIQEFREFETCYIQSFQYVLEHLIFFFENCDMSVNFNLVTNT